MAKGNGKGNGSRWFRILDEPRNWENFYRGRWAYDKSVRTSHGVNCSGSCSWEVFVKDGLITWELQKTDWPQINSETPNYEPRGCQRGISSSWYPYSPVRPKYPYVRAVLLDYYRSEREAVYLEVGTRARSERVHYPDVDFMMERDGTGRRYFRKSGAPIRD